jgi:hypothetical protein
VDDDGTCTSGPGSTWYPIPQNATDPDFQVATASAGSPAATARLNFGLRVGASQLPGRYEAELVLEVVSP